MMPSRYEFMPDRKVIAALLLMTGLRILFASEIAFLEDEAYYRLWGLYPSYAYFDHAPMVGWWIAAGQALFGDTHLGLRFLSPVAGLVGSLFLWRLTYLLSDRDHANIAVLAFNAMFLVGIGTVIMTPDIPSVFFWTLSLWAIVEWNKSNQPRWWILFGLISGLGLLSKYTNIFFGVGVILWLAISGRWRDAIRTPQFWLAGLIAVLLFSPVLYWNWAHEWASFAKQFGRLGNSAFTSRYLGEWLAGQIFMISPILIIPVVVGAYHLIVRASYGQNTMSVIVLTAAPLLIYFLYNSLTNRINANWTAPVFPNFAIIASFQLLQWRAGLSRYQRMIAHVAIPSAYAISLLVLASAMFAFLPPDRRNPISNIRGYEDLATAIEKERLAYGAKFIVTSRYSLTGLLSYELRDRAPVVQLNDRIRFGNMPEPDPSLATARSIYVTDDRNVNGFISSATPCFKSAQRLASIAREDRGVPLLTYHLWLIEGINPVLLETGDIARCVN